MLAKRSKTTSSNESETNKGKNTNVHKKQIIARRNAVNALQLTRVSTSLSDGKFY